MNNNMKKIFSIKQLDLVLIQKSIAKFVSDKYIIPACGFIKITGKEGLVEIEATNLEVSYKTTLKATFTEPFQICIESKFINALDKRDIELEFYTDDQICEIKYPGGILRVLCMEPKDYIQSVFTGDLICTVDFLYLNNAISASLGISSDEKYKSTMATGLVLSGDNEGFNVCAAFGGMIACNTTIQCDSDNMICQITNSSARFIQSLSDNPIHVFRNNGVTIFSDGVSDVSIRDLALEIKDTYKKLIRNMADSLDTKINIVSKSFMVSQINKTTLFLKSEHNSVLTIRLKDGEFEFVAGDNGQEMSVQQFPLGYKKQTSDTIKVNYNFLLSTLQKIKGEEFELRIHSNCDSKVDKSIYITDGITDFLIGVMV